MIGGRTEFQKLNSWAKEVWGVGFPLLLRTLEKSHPKFNRSTKLLQAHFLEIASELWVASELERLGLKPQLVGKRRKADIFLGKIGVEVKASKRNSEDVGGTNVPWWGFNFGEGTQLRERDYRAIVFVRASADGVPEDAMIVTREELLKYEWPKRGVGKEKAVYLELSDSYPNYRRLMVYWGKGWFETSFERIVHGEPSRFHNRWDKIASLRG